MDPRLSAPFLMPDRISNALQLEVGLLIFGLAIISWIVFKVFFGQKNSERHSSLKRQIKNVFILIFIGVLFFILYLKISHLTNVHRVFLRVTPYIGLITILIGAYVFIRTCRILISEYLFLSHMTHGVPVLLINVFTLILSLGIAGWIATEIFSIRLAPLLATSTILSLILGLALQETLGGLFAGISLQLDKPYEIEDWIEIQIGQQKLAGKVKEISWRSTTLISFSDELITIPNRIMGNSQIQNYGTGNRVFTRSILFRVPHDENLERVKQTLQKATHEEEEISQTDPSPIILIQEVTESYHLIKVVYGLKDYSRQNIIASRLSEKCLKNLEQAKIKLAHQKVEILSDSLNLRAG